MVHAFLSYSVRYGDWANVLRQNVEAALGDGRTLFLDQIDLGAGQPATNRIQRALDEARYFILLATPEALASPWVGMEITSFIENRPEVIAEGRLIVANLVDTPLPPFVKKPQRIEFLDPANYRQGAAKLVAALNGGTHTRNLPVLDQLKDPPPLPRSIERDLRRRLVDAMKNAISDRGNRMLISSALYGDENLRRLESYPSDACAASAALVDRRDLEHPEAAALRTLDRVIDELSDSPALVEPLANLRDELVALLPRETIAATGDPFGEYRTYLRGVHSQLVRFFPEAADQTLDQVHVDIDVEQLDRHVAMRLGSKEPDAHPATLHGLLSHPPDDATRVTGRWLVVGEPGAGKSTIARHLAFKLAGDSSGPIPVYASLARCAAENLDPFDLVEKDLQGSDGNSKASIATALRDLATSGEASVWLLLDGLDEVSKEHLATLKQRLTRWSDLYKGARIVVLTRPIERLILGPEFPVARLRRLDPPRQLRLLTNWLRSDEKAQALHQRITAKSRLASLASNPLLLTLIAKVAMEPQLEGKEKRELPGTRGELYRQAIDTLLRREFRDGTGRVDQFNIDNARAALQEIALSLQASDQIAWSRDDLVKPFNEARTSVSERDLPFQWETVEAFLRDCSDVLPHDGSDKVYGFLHRQFREFLAAEALHHRGPLAGLDRVRELEEEDLPRWSEVFGLLCPMFGRPVEFLREIRKVSGPLAMRALPDVEGLEPAEMLEFFGDLEPDSLWKIVSSWNIDDPERCDVARETLWQLVAPERSTDELAYLHHTLTRIGKPPDRRLFFDRCERSIDTIPDVTFVPIPSGEFWMGSDEHEEGRFDDEGPRHKVTVSSFELANTTITRCQFRRFDDAYEPTQYDVVKEDGLLPATDITWWSAYLFCHWIGARLPTEAEWEYACRAGTETRYSFGDDAQELADHGWYFVNSGNKKLRADTGWEEEKLEEWGCRPHAIGEKPPNAWKLHDMHGNVFEWCEDAWHNSYEGAPADGTAWLEEAAERRVIRGGAFNLVARSARSAYRDGSVATLRWYLVGFRPARSVTPS